MLSQNKQYSLILHSLLNALLMISLQSLNLQIKIVFNICITK